MQLGTHPAIRDGIGKQTVLHLKLAMNGFPLQLKMRLLRDDDVLVAPLECLQPHGHMCAFADQLFVDLAAPLAALIFLLRGIDGSLLRVEVALSSANLASLCSS